MPRNTKQQQRSQQQHYIPDKGVSDQTKKRLAQDIEFAGGIDEFDADQPFALGQLLNRPQREEYYGKAGSKYRKRISNLVKNQWKVWPKEKYLKKVFFPLIINQESSPSPQDDDGTTNKEEEEEAEVEQGEDEEPPKPPSPRKAPQRAPTVKPPQRARPTSTNTQQKSTPSKPADNMPTNDNDLGDIVRVDLDDGLIFVALWVDTKLDPQVLQLLVGPDGLSVKLRTKKPRPKSAAELLAHYSWSKDKTNFVCKGVNSELRKIKKRGSANEWKEDEVLYLDEEVSRTFVDMDGSPSGQCGHRTDADGRQMITFFLKKIGYEDAPSAAVFTNTPRTKKPPKKEKQGKFR